jgi:hypothetical protein
MILADPYGTLADRIEREGSSCFQVAIVGCLLNDVWIRMVSELPPVSDLMPRHPLLTSCLPDLFSGIFSVWAVWLGVLQCGSLSAPVPQPSRLSSISFVLVADVCQLSKGTCT